MFSLDSVITAVGLAEHLPVMIIAIIIAVGVMMFAAGAIGRFVDTHPTIKMLALSFLVLIGVALIAVAFAYFWTTASRTALFWTAFILTRPLGAVVGDFLDKPIAQGGLALSRYAASAALLLFIIFLVWLLPQQAARESH